jgi:hypothetical protein
VFKVKSPTGILIINTGNSLKERRNGKDPFKKMSQHEFSIHELSIPFEGQESISLLITIVYT